MQWALLPVALALLSPAATIHAPDEDEHLVPSDGGSGKDADDLCNPNVAPAITIQPNVPLYGFFFVRPPPALPGDRSDVYGFELLEPRTVTVRMKPAPALPFTAPTPNYDLRLFQRIPGIILCQELGSSHRPQTQEEQITRDLGPGQFAIQAYVPNSFPFEAGRSDTAFYCDPFCTVAGYEANLQFPS